MDMSLSALSIGASSIDSSNALGLAMVKKSLEAIEQNGENLNRMMLESSVTPHLGQNINYLV